MAVKTFKLYTLFIILLIFSLLIQVPNCDNNTLKICSEEPILSNNVVNLVNDNTYAVNSQSSLSMSSPDDVYFTLDYQWALDKISIRDAWNLEKGSDSVKVGVIDTGIDFYHPDLRNNMDEDLLMDFSGSNMPYIGHSGHASMVAGIIGAETNNGIGIAGVCWNVKMVSLKIQDSTEATEAINYAEKNKIPIINISWQFAADDNLKKAIDNYSGLIVIAAGNDNANLDLDTESWYQYDNDNIILVGSTNCDDEKSTFSNYSKTIVDIFAPGGEKNATDKKKGIFTTTDHYGYTVVNGTSLSAPFVAGVAALLLSKYPTMSALKLKSAIMHNVDRIDGLRDLCVSGGRLNAYSTLLNPYKEHSFTVMKGNFRKHKCQCKYCDYYYSEEHEWVTSIDFRVCLKCGTRLSLGGIIIENAGIII